MCIPTWGMHLIITIYIRWILKGMLYCKGTGGYVVHDVGHYTSDSPSSSGAVNTKAVASVPTLTLLTSVIKWSLASDVAFFLVPMAWPLGGMSFCSATDLSCSLLACNLLDLQLSQLSGSSCLPERMWGPAKRTWKLWLSLICPKLTWKSKPFLGLMGHYWWFIKGFAHIIQPLHEHLSGEGASKKSK